MATVEFIIVMMIIIKLRAQRGELIVVLSSWSFLIIDLPVLLSALLFVWSGAIYFTSLCFSFVKVR